MLGKHSQPSFCFILRQSQQIAHTGLGTHSVAQAGLELAIRLPYSQVAGIVGLRLNKNFWLSKF